MEKSNKNSKLNQQEREMLAKVEKRIVRREKRARRRRNISNVSQRTTQPLARSNTTKNKTPKFMPIKGGVRVPHSEYVGKLLGTDAALLYHLNPNNYTLFPWLSGVAQNFEKFKIVSLQIRYENVTNATTSGQFWCYADYDPNDHIPTNLDAALNMYKVTTIPVYRNGTMTLTTAKFNSLKDYFVLPTNWSIDETDFKWYYPASVVFGIDNSGVTGLNGRVFIDYVIDLYVPDLMNNIPPPFGSISAVNNCGITSSGNPYITDPSAVTGGALGLPKNVNVLSSGLQFLTAAKGLLNLVMWFANTETGLNSNRLNLIGSDGVLLGDPLEWITKANDGTSFFWQASYPFSITNPQGGNISFNSNLGTSGINGSLQMNVTDLPRNATF